MCPYVVERYISVDVDEISWVGQATVGSVDGTFQIIDEHRPWYAFFFLVTSSIVPFLLKTLISRYFRAGMRLSDHHIDEGYLASPKSMKSLQRLNRADGGRSSEGTEVQ
jgi:hypothetical protein